MIIYKTTNLINGKIYIGKDKTYKPVDPKVKEIIISLAQSMSRNKIYETITNMGIKCPSKRTLGRRLNEWKKQLV